MGYFLDIGYVQYKIGRGFSPALQTEELELCSVACQG